jgi:hypothetical protein
VHLSRNDRYMTSYLRRSLGHKLPRQRAPAQVMATGQLARIAGSRLPVNCLEGDAEGVARKPHRPSSQQRAADRAGAKLPVRRADCGWCHERAGGDHGGYPLGGDRPSAGSSPLLRTAMTNIDRPATAAQASDRVLYRTGGEMALPVSGVLSSQGPRHLATPVARHAQAHVCGAAGLPG